MSGATGFHLAAADVTGLGRDQIIVAPGGSGQHTLTALAYDPSTTSWTVARTVADVPVKMSYGVSISAGDVTGDRDVVGLVSENEARRRVPS